VLTQLVRALCALILAGGAFAAGRYGWLAHVRGMARVRSGR
jgi:hypothetical protein